MAWTQAGTRASLYSNILVHAHSLRSLSSVDVFVLLAVLFAGVAVDDALSNSEQERDFAGARRVIGNNFEFKRKEKTRDLGAFHSR